MTAAYQHLERAHAYLFSSISGTDASDATQSRASSVRSETLSVTALRGVKALTIDATSPAVISTSTPKKKKSSTPPPKAPKAQKTSTSAPLYHQCVLCGWASKASNKNMSRHFKEMHKNYSHVISDGNKYFYLRVDDPYEIWPILTPKPWSTDDLLGVEGVRASWLNIKPPKAAKSAPTATTSKAPQKAKTPKGGVKSKEFISDSSDSDDAVGVSPRTASRGPDLSEDSDSDA